MFFKSLRQRPICLSVKSVFTAFLTQKHAREYEKERRMVKRKKKQLKKVRKRTDWNKENIFYSFWTGVKCSTDSKRMQFRLKLQTPALI